jgi:hypothetical protein
VGALDGKARGVPMKDMTELANEILDDYLRSCGHPASLMLHEDEDVGVPCQECGVGRIAVHLGRLRDEDFRLCDEARKREFGCCFAGVLEPCPIHENKNPSKKGPP